EKYTSPMSITAVRLRNLSAEFDTPASDRTSLASPTTRARIRIPLAKLTYSGMVLPNIFISVISFTSRFARFSHSISFRGEAPDGGMGSVRVGHQAETRYNRRGVEYGEGGFLAVAYFFPAGVCRAFALLSPIS